MFAHLGPGFFCIWRVDLFFFLCVQNSDRVHWNKSFRLHLHSFPSYWSIPYHLHHPQNWLSSPPCNNWPQSLAMGQCHPLCLCVYLWMAEPQNNAATLQDWFWYGRGGDGGGGEGSSFPTAGAWYRVWQKVSLATGWCDACVAEGKAAVAAHTGAATVTYTGERGDLSLFPFFGP